ncbi:hypothetical protein CYMTET_19523 [Cymbomonas tetramitiformis]|uniref:Uncharacterized protein n=1 Tax=Cymbomonas tetramitiformis TaxID=36881 RepID=A0AAE0G5X7_9CHLO|nr:hypothetical protein CYMTET_19523 [Cymbomonas tetramitiformis]
MLPDILQDAETKVDTGTSESVQSQLLEATHQLSKHMNTLTVQVNMEMHRKARVGAENGLWILLDLHHIKLCFAFDISAQLPWCFSQRPEGEGRAAGAGEAAAGGPATGGELAAGALGGDPQAAGGRRYSNGGGAALVRAALVMRAGDSRLRGGVDASAERPVHSWQLGHVETARSLRMGRGHVTHPGPPMRHFLQGSRTRALSVAHHKQQDVAVSLEHITDALRKEQRGQRVRTKRRLVVSLQAVSGLPEPLEV